MGRIEGLIKAYEEFVFQAWSQHLSGAEKTWFAVYEPAQERRLQLRIPEFANATAKAGHGWQHVQPLGCLCGVDGRSQIPRGVFRRP